MADRVAVMYAGKIVETGTAEDIFYRNSHPYTQALLKSLPTVDIGREGAAGVHCGHPAGPAEAAQGLRLCRPVQALHEDLPGGAAPRVHVGEGHTAACWLLHPDCPSAEERGEKMATKSARCSSPWKTSANTSRCPAAP